MFSLIVTGDQQAAATAYQVAEEKTAGSGPKMDLVFSLLRYDKHLAYQQTFLSFLNTLLQLSTC